MENANVLSHLVSLGAELETASAVLEGFHIIGAGKVGSIRFYFFEGTGCVSKAMVVDFFRAHGEGCLIIAQSGGRLIDVYAQTFLDREPVCVEALEWKKNDEFWALFEQPGYLEFVFELDRRFGRRRLEKRFVAEFRAKRAALARSWNGLTDDRDETRMQAALDTMLRMFFVAFLAARGTLDGRRLFISEEALRCAKSGRSIYRDFIQPLFFETLNRPMRYRTRRARALGNIPFLNGGLFTPTEIEAGSPQLNAPNDIWLDIIDFLGKYALSTDYAETRPVLRLDPMMLGHVFEALMPKSDRNATGSYYTPMPLARRLVKEAFECYLARNCGLTEAEARHSVETGDFGFLTVSAARSLDMRLADVTILDPAVGSGAFLQCALECLHKLRTGLKCRCREAFQPGQLARQIVSRNLYGVDIMPAANQLCELRLWLELIQFFGEDEALPSLPNLDLNICCGDSLADLSQYARVLGVTLSAKRLEAIGSLKEKYRLSTGHHKKKLSAEIHEQMNVAGLEMFRSFSETLEAECRVLENSEKTLFADAPAVSFSDRQRLAVLHDHRKKLDSAIRSGSLPGFSYNLDFNEILENGGFDMVLGNPPWFSLHTLPAEKQRVLKALYETATGCRGAKLQAADVSALFVEKAVSCVQAQGIVTMLVPNKLFQAPSYQKFRRFLSSHAEVLRYCDWTNDRGNAFDAATYPASLSLAKVSSPSEVSAFSEAKADEGRLAGIHAEKISDRFSIRKGICTEANDVFIAGASQSGTDGLIDMQFRAAPGETVPVERELVCPVLRGAGISAYHLETREMMLFTHERNAPGVPMKQLPAHAEAWVMRNAEKLRVRYGMGHKPLHALFGCAQALQSMKVVWRDISKNLEASFCSDPDIKPLNTVYYIPVEDEDTGYLLAAWLNSSVARALCRTRAEHAQNDYRRYLAWVVGDLPWIFASKDATICAKKGEIIELSRAMHSGSVKPEDGQERLDSLIQTCMAHYSGRARDRQRGLFEHREKFAQTKHAEEASDGRYQNIG